MWYLRKDLKKVSVKTPCSRPGKSPPILSVGWTCDLLLTNRTWHRWLAGTPLWHVECVRSCRRLPFATCTRKIFLPCWQKSVAVLWGSLQRRPMASDVQHCLRKRLWHKQFHCTSNWLWGSFAIKGKITGWQFGLTYSRYSYIIKHLQPTLDPESLNDQLWESIVTFSEIRPNTTLTMNLLTLNVFKYYLYFHFSQSP